MFMIIKIYISQDSNFKSGTIKTLYFKYINSVVVVVVCLFVCGLQTHSRQGPVCTVVEYVHVLAYHTLIHIKRSSKASCTSLL